MRGPMADDDVTLFGKIKNKLLDSKQKWAEEGRLLTGKTAAHSQRLPPGQRRVENWPVLDLGIQPEIPAHAWRLFVDGEVENPLTWKWGEFTDLPKTRLTSDIHCVTAWSRYDNTWIGVPMRAMLSPFTAISPRYQGAPVPSTMRALRNKRSYCAHANDEKVPAISIKKHRK